jgi:hypothetical protein
MKVLHNTSKYVVTLLALQTLWMSASPAQSPAQAPAEAPVKAAISQEISKQESIYQSKGEQTPTGYSVDRSLEDYGRGLSTGFERTLASLGPKDRWLDIGAGKGEAILDYFSPGYNLKFPEGREQRGAKAHAIAMSIEDRRTPRWQQDAAALGATKIQYLFNRRLHEYSVDEIGKFQVITDVIGGFSYTDDLTVFMEKVLGFLELNGSFFTLLQDVHSERGVNRPFYAGASFLTELTHADGSELKVCAWLKSISCVEVTCEFTTSWKPPIEAYRVRKTCNNVSVPVLTPNHYTAGTPPERRFRISNLSPATAER